MAYSYQLGICINTEYKPYDRACSYAIRKYLRSHLQSVTIFYEYQTKYNEKITGHKLIISI